MSLQINDVAPDFEAETTEGRIRFHDWIGDSLQLTAKHKVATPVNWERGEDVIIAGSVSDEDAKKIYPKGFDRSRRLR
jgi:alkyl hydroperoxide reductase subunit AhpC